MLYELTHPSFCPEVFANVWVFVWALPQRHDAMVKKLENPLERGWTLTTPKRLR